MRNKKGFTLIELLAIIVILAIIAVITVPIILNIIDNAEKGSIEDSALGYKDALQKYYATKSVQNPEQELPSGYMEISELPSDFTVSGENPTDGWVKLKNGIVEEYSLKYKDYVVTKYLDKDVATEKSELIRFNIPEEYTGIEYLQGNGSQYIDTGTYLQNGEIATLKFSLNSNKQYQVIFGQSSSGLGSLQTRPKLNWYNKSTDISIEPVLNKIYNCSVRLNGNTGEATIDGKTGTFDVSEDNTNMLLFSRQNATNYEMNGKIYSFKMGNRRYLVPVIRKSDNKPGMLDLANYSSNLFDIEQMISSYSSNIIDNGSYIEVTPLGAMYSTGINVSIPANTVFSVTPVDIGDYTATNVRFRFIGVNDEVKEVYLTNSDGSVKSRVSVSIPFAIKSIRLNWSVGGKFAFKDAMLNEGSTALPYEPYKKSFYINEGTGEFIAGPEI